MREPPAGEAGASVEVGRRYRAFQPTNHPHPTPLIEIRGVLLVLSVRSSTQPTATVHDPEPGGACSGSPVGWPRRCPVPPSPEREAPRSEQPPPGPPSQVSWPSWGLHPCRNPVPVAARPPSDAPGSHPYPRWEPPSCRSRGGGPPPPPSLGGSNTFWEVFLDAAGPLAFLNTAPRPTV